MIDGSSSTIKILAVIQTSFIDRQSQRKTTARSWRARGVDRAAVRFNRRFDQPQPQSRTSHIFLIAAPTAIEPVEYAWQVIPVDSDALIAYLYYQQIFRDVRRYRDASS